MDGASDEAMCFPRAVDHRAGCGCVGGERPEDWLFVAGIDEFPLANVNPYQLFNGSHRHVVFSLTLSLSPSVMSF